MGARENGEQEGAVRVYVVGRIVAAMLATSAGCRQDPPPDAGHGNEARARPAPRTPPQPASPVRPPGRGAQVIVDVSQSLAGFTATRSEGRRGRVRWRDGGSTRMSSLHEQVIERALAQLRANAPFKRCLLDATLHCNETPVAARSFDLPETYRGSDAALDRVLRRPPSVARADAQAQDALDPYAVTLLLTDGFQTTVLPSPTASPDVQCAGGADPACLGNLLAARVREGYGVWIGRIVMPFAGTYYPERPISGEMWQRVEAHVDDLNTNHPEWTGVVFGARRGDRESPSGAFRWEGARPLLVLVLSRDLALGRGLVARMQQFLPNEQTIFARSAAADVAFAELAPFEGAAARIREASIRRTQNSGAANAVRIAPATRDAQGVQVSVRCTLEGVASFDVDASFARSPLIPTWVATDPDWRPVGAAAPWLQRGARRGGLNTTFNIDCRRLPRGVHRQSYGVFVEWRRSAGLAQQWFMTESAESSYESPERVYRLREMVTPPIETATSRRGWLDTLHVTVTRE